MISFVLYTAFVLACGIASGAVLTACGVFERIADRVRVLRVRRCARLPIARLVSSPNYERLAIPTVLRKRQSMPVIDV